MPKQGSELTNVGMKLKVLIYGESGTYKTGFASTFPKPYFFDFDDGLLTIAGKDFTYDHYIDEFKNGVLRRSACQTFEARFDEIAASPDNETLVIDSMTTYSMALLRDICATSKHTEPTLPDYRKRIEHIRDLLTRIQSVDKHVVVIAHEQVEKDDVVGDIHYIPMMAGDDLPYQMPVFFDEVYRSVAIKVRIDKEDVSTFRLHTRSQARFTAKSRLGVADMEKPNFTVIMDNVRTAQDNQKGEEPL